MVTARSCTSIRPCRWKPRNAAFRLYRALPSQVRAYRSSTRSALASKPGSQGKIYELRPQGRMASSDSHSQMVVLEISATIPRLTTSAVTPDTCSRDGGTPNCDGNWQAGALTATTTSLGKDRWLATRGRSSSPSRPLLEEPP